MEQHETWQIVLVLSLGAAFAVCCLAAFATGLAASFHTRPGLRPSGTWILMGGILHMWPKEAFTDRGLRYRRACLQCYLYGLIFFLLGALAIWVS